MENTALLVITHGDFGQYLLKSTEMLIGEQEHASALGLHPGESVDDLFAKAAQIVVQNKEKGLDTIVLVDLLGGSPSNAAVRLLKDHALTIITGANMPMMVETLTGYAESPEEMIAAVMEAGKNGIGKLDRSLFQ